MKHFPMSSYTGVTNL